jgi:4-amino-4-deoxy-L-arabinose transferase-like glycosyltransferase
MSYLVYLTLLPPIILGFLFVSWLLLPTRKGNLLLFLSLGIPVGFGINACLFFLWSFIFNPSFPGFWLVELALIASLLFLNWKQRLNIPVCLPDFKKWTRLDWVLGAIFVIVAVIGLAAFFNYTNANPHGRYDAWAIWNVRARMLTRGGEHWKTVFIPQVFHADYPLLVPLTIARAWIMAGTESQRIPPAVAGLFTFATSGILVGSLFSLAKKQTSWLAGIVLLSTPWVIYFGSLQFADLPLAAFMLAACSCLCLALFDRQFSAKWFILAGLSAGLAAWVKNEGQLFLLVFLVVSIVSIVLTFKKFKPIRHVGIMLLGLLLPIIVILLFKLTLAPANDVVDTGNLNPAISQLFSLPRYGEVINALQDYPKGFGGWAVPIPLAFLLVWMFLRPRINDDNKSAILTVAGLLILQWVGYFLIYVITPHQLQSHINQSYDRLLMHLYPSFLLFLFLFLPTLESLFEAPLKSD